MVDLLYTHKVADPASLEYDENNVKLALETGTVALTYNWRACCRRPTTRPSRRRRPTSRSTCCGQQGCEERQRQRLGGLADPEKRQNKDAAWKLLEYMASPAWQKKGR